MKVLDKKIDQNGNDAKYIKKMDVLSIQTKKLTCPIHKKQYYDHLEDEFLEDYNISSIRYQKSRGQLYHTDQIKLEEIQNYDDMVKKGVSNYDLQAAVASQCRADFDSQLEYTSYMSSLTFKLLFKITEHDFNTKNDLKKIAVLLGTKNFRLLTNGVNLTCDGYSDAAMILIRTSIENTLLLNYLVENPDKSPDYYNGNKKINIKELLKNDNKKSDTFGKLWGFISKLYVHPTREYLSTAITNDGDNSRVNIFPSYNKEACELILVTISCMKLLNILTLKNIFGDDVDDKILSNEELQSCSMALMKIIENSKWQIEFDEPRTDNF